MSRPEATRLPRPLCWWSSHPEATRLPRPLRGAPPPPQGFPATTEDLRPPSTPPLRGSRGPLRRPPVPHSPPPLTRVLLPPNTAGLRCFPFAPPLPQSGPAPCLVGCCTGGLSGCRSRRPSHPLISLLPRFVACPMVTPSESRILTPDLPRASRFPPSLCLMRCRSPHPIPGSHPPPVSLLPSSCMPLRPLAPPLVILPLVPASDIAHKDKDVRDRTDGVVVRESLAGRSARLVGKSPVGLA